MELLLLGLAAGPTAWIVQLVVGYGVASHACFPSIEPWLTSPPPGWALERVWLSALNLGCLAVALAAAVLSWRNWRRSPPQAGGDIESAMEIVEGRTRFLSSCGVLVGTVFSIAILFGTLQPFVLASCWSIAS